MQKFEETSDPIADLRIDLLKSLIVNEKFIEQSDPIQDIGIGLYNFWKKKYHEIGSSTPSFTYEKYFNKKYSHDTSYNCVYVLWDTLLYLIEKNEPQKAFNKACQQNKYITPYLRKEIAKVLKEHFFIDVDPLDDKLNENFKEDSDPIEDMGIGLRAIWNNLSTGDIFRFKKTLKLESKYIFTNKYYAKGTYLVIINVNNSEYYSTKTITYNYYPTTSENFFETEPLEKYHIWTWDYDFFVKYFELVHKAYINESINEKFIEESDPIKDLGIGMREIIIKFMKDHYEYQDGSKEEMLKKSCIYSRPDFVEFLIADGADIHSGQDAALRQAAYNGCIECMKLLLDAGANINALNGAALTWAVQNNQYEAVKFLLQNGADPNINEGKALREAFIEGHTKIFKTLLDYGADIYAYNDWIFRRINHKSISNEMRKIIQEYLNKEKTNNK